MPLHFRIDDDLGLVITRAEGEVTDEDLLDHALNLIKMPSRPLAELVDFSGRTEITVSIDAVRRMGDLLRSKDVNTPGARLALVGKTDGVFGMLRLFEAHRSSDEFEIMAFRDREEALRWLAKVMKPEPR